MSSELWFCNACMALFRFICKLQTLGFFHFTAHSQICFQVFCIPRIQSVLFPQKWIFTNKVFEPGACGVPRLSPFISHYSCHWTLIMLLFYCCRWFIIWVHNLKFIEMSYFLVLFWYCHGYQTGLMYQQVSFSILIDSFIFQEEFLGG